MEAEQGDLGDESLSDDDDDKASRPTSCVVCRGVHDVDKMLFCDGCADGQHLYCW